MYVGFEWDSANAEQVARHDVRPEEAEQAIDDPQALSIPAYESSGEVRFGVSGATEESRVLVVSYTGHSQLQRVATARG